MASEYTTRPASYGAGMCVLLAVLLTVVGCEKKDPRYDIRDRQRVTLYADGEAVRSWVSDGGVEFRSARIGEYVSFYADGREVRVTGSVVVEPVEKGVE